jgi:hypothetical protein
MEADKGGGSGGNGSQLHSFGTRYEHGRQGRSTVGGLVEVLLEGVRDTGMELRRRTVGGIWQHTAGQSAAYGGSIGGIWRHTAARYARSAHGRRNPGLTLRTRYVFHRNVDAGT